MLRRKKGKTYFKNPVKSEPKDAESEAEPSPGEDGAEGAAVEGSPTEAAPAAQPQRVKTVYFFSNNKSMAFVEMVDLQSAFDAIVNVHGRCLEERDGGTKKRCLFVHFSKVHLSDYMKTGWKTYFRG